MKSEREQERRAPGDGLTVESRRITVSAAARDGHRTRTTHIDLAQTGEGGRSTGRNEGAGETLNWLQDPAAQPARVRRRGKRGKS